MDFEKIKKIVHDKAAKGAPQAETAKQQLSELIETTKNFEKDFPGTFSGNFTITKECKAKYEDLRRLVGSVKAQCDDADLELECLLHMKSALDQKQAGNIQTQHSTETESSSPLKQLLLWAKKELSANLKISDAEKELETLEYIAKQWDNLEIEKPVMRMLYVNSKPDKKDEKFTTHLEKVIKQTTKAKKSDAHLVDEAKRELQDLLRKHVAYQRQVKTNDSKTPDVKIRSVALRKKTRDRQSFRGSILVVEKENKRGDIRQLFHLGDPPPLPPKPNTSIREQQEERLMIGQNSYVENLQREKTQLQEKIDELTTRLSSFASKQLSDGNPNFTDLSDANRPTRIADKFGEMYDNEWTDAYDDLMKESKSTEEKVISDLCNIILMTFEFCKTVSKSQLDDLTLQMEHSVTNVKYEQDGKSAELEKVEGSVQHFVSADRFAREWRKASAMSSVPALSVIFKEQKCKGNHFDPYKYNNVEVYIDKCIELTWLMAVQNPQMDLQIAKPGSKVDRDVFSYYLKKGNEVEMTVWPAVFLYEGGPIISKGYVLPQ